jgi:hypothetical protein
MLYVPSRDFLWYLSSESGVRPAANYGTTVTPAQNSKGSWAEVFSDTEIVNDVYDVLINVNSNAAAASIRDTLLDIGTDPAGGTSYTTVIPDLLVSAASPLFSDATFQSGGGIWYHFPLWIPAGAAIAARASVNNATVGTLRVWMQVFGRPRYPDLVKVGHRVTAYGITAASSSGTAVTPGTTSEGSYVSLGTPTVSNWWWQLGVGCADTTMGRVGYAIDLAAGDVTNKRVLIEDYMVYANSSAENISQELMPSEKACGEVPASVEIWGRMQAGPGNADAGISMAAYGLGG